MEHVRWHSDLALRSPTLIAAFTGWSDGAEAASTALRTMVEGWGATLVASIDPEEFTDFASTRPHVRLADGVTREIMWPQVAIWAASTPGGDVLLLLGPEPSLRWRLFTEELLDLARHYGTQMAISLGALLADVPHSRQVHLIGTATEQDIIDRFDLQRSRYEGPTGILGVFQDACSRAGMPAASLWAATPAYASQISSPKAAMALVERAAEMIGTPAPILGLQAGVDDYERQVDDLLEQDPELRGYVRRLESIADSGEDDEDEDDSDPDDSEPIAEADGDQLIEELERFLRDQGGNA